MTTSEGPQSFESNDSLSSLGKSFLEVSHKLIQKQFVCCSSLSVILLLIPRNSLCTCFTIVRCLARAALAPIVYLPKINKRRLSAVRVTNKYLHSIASNACMHSEALSRQCSDSLHWALSFVAARLQSFAPLSSPKALRILALPSVCWCPLFMCLQHMISQIMSQTIKLFATCTVTFTLVTSHFLHKILMTLHAADWHKSTTKTSNYWAAF